VIFHLRSSIFEAHLQEPLTLENQDLQWIPLHKIFNRKIIIIYFQNYISIDAKSKLQKENFQKYNLLKIVI